MNREYRKLELMRLEGLKLIRRILNKMIKSTEDFLGCEPKDACKTHGRCWVHSDWA